MHNVTAVCPNSSVGMISNCECTSAYTWLVHMNCGDVILDMLNCKNIQVGILDMCFDDWCARIDFVVPKISNFALLV